MLPKSSKKIIVKGRKVTIYIHGNGIVPCMFVGAAGIFRKAGMLPNVLKGIFTFYFIDLWDLPKTNINVKTPQANSCDKLDWNLVVDEIEEGRANLGLEKIVIMGHSAAGAMPIEYARKYPNRCLLVIPIAFSPIWTEKLAIYRDKFIKGDKPGFVNLSRERQNLIVKLDRAYKASLNKMSPQEAFILKFIADRPLYWKDYKSAGPKISYMWKNYCPDVSKVEVYNTRLLNGYDFFSNPLKNVPILWCLGLYDYFIPVDLFIDELRVARKNEKLSNIDYHVFDSGHYPMIETPEKFANVIQAKVKSYGWQQF
jgi:proline iminopeptidase